MVSIPSSEDEVIFHLLFTRIIRKMEKIWKPALAVGGIGAIGAFVFYGLNKEWLQLSIFARLTDQQTFYIMSLFLLLVFAVSLSMIVAWVFQERGKRVPTGKPGFEAGIDEGWDFQKTAEVIASNEGYAVRFIGFKKSELQTPVKSRTLRAQDTGHALKILGLILERPISNYDVSLIEDFVFELKVR